MGLQEAAHPSRRTETYCRGDDCGCFTNNDTMGSGGTMTGIKAYKRCCLREASFLQEKVLERKTKVVQHGKNVNWCGVVHIKIIDICEVNLTSIKKKRFKKHSHRARNTAQCKSAYPDV